MRDRSHAAATRHERIPEGLEPDSVRREDPHSGNYDTITFRHWLSIKNRIWGNERTF